MESSSLGAANVFLPSSDGSRPGGYQLGQIVDAQGMLSRDPLVGHESAMVDDIRMSVGGYTGCNYRTDIPDRPRTMNKDCSKPFAGGPCPACPLMGHGQLMEGFDLAKKQKLQFEAGSHLGIWPGVRIKFASSATLEYQRWILWIALVGLVLTLLPKV